MWQDMETQFLAFSEHEQNQVSDANTRHEDTLNQMIRRHGQQEGVLKRRRVSVTSRDFGEQGFNQTLYGWI